MQNETLLNRQQALKALGIGSVRTLQVLVKQRRLVKRNLPGEPTGGPKPRNECYTEESVNAELERRRTGLKPPGGFLTPAVSAAIASVAAPPQQQASLASAQIDAFTAMAEHLAKLNAEYPPQLPAIPGGAFLTIKEAAKWKRRSETWVREQCASGRLNHERTKRGGYVILLRDLEALPSDSTLVARVKGNVA